MKKSYRASRVSRKKYTRGTVTLICDYADHKRNDNFLHDFRIRERQ